MGNSALPRNSSLPEGTVIALAALFLAALLAIPRDVLGGVSGYLPFHMFAETFSIVISIAIFGVMWNAYRAEHSAGLLLLACAMLATGLLDFAHMLSVSRMPDFVTPSSPDKGITFWLAARITAAAGMMLAAVWPETRLRGSNTRYIVLAVFLAITALVYWIGLFHRTWLPRFFVDGSGLTPVKIWAEYLIVAALTIPAVIFYRRARRTHTNADLALFAAVAISILSEMYFAIYAATHDLFQVLGHAYKVIGYGFLYRAVLVAGVQHPLRELQLHAVQDGINTIFKEAITCETEKELGQTCLKVAEEITGSKFGYIGELNAEGTLDAITISNPGWDACEIPEALVLLKHIPVRGIFGKVVGEGRSVIANDPASHPDRIRIPEGHPRVTSYLGVPLKQGDRVVGVVSVANREGGYTDSNREDLEALSVAIVAALMRKRAEDKLRRAKEDWEQTFDAVPDLIAIIDPQHHIVRANVAMATRLGLTPEQCIGRTCYTCVHRTDAPPAVCPHMRTLADGAEHATELREPNLGGDFLVTTTPLRDPARKLIGSVHVARDITERKRTEEALRASEARYRSLFEHMLHGFAYCQMAFDEHGQPEDFVYLAVNEAFGRLTGLTDVVGKRVTQVIPRIKELTPELFEVYGRVAKTGTPEEFEIDFTPLGLYLSISVYSPAKGYFVAVFDDITARKHTEATLRASKAQLEAANKALEAARTSAERAKADAERANHAKDQFLAVLSHELRTPLTPVLTAVELMRRRASVAPDDRESLEIVRRNVQLQARLIDDLLDLTRIVQGKLELKRRPIDICTVIERAVEIVKPDIEARRLDFEVTLKDAPHRVDGDPSRLQQVVWNLLTNAVKFTPEGGSVGLRCERFDADVVLEVNDSGIGIEAEAAERIFDAFEQGGRATTRQFGGLGLGLAIVKRLVEMHDGKVSVRSDGRNRGATFRVQLPISSAAPEPDEYKLAPELEARGKRILLVEDNADTAMTTKMLLEFFGYGVETAGDVSQALKAIDLAHFDLMISDLGLPDGSGTDLLREIRRRGNTLKGIAMSGYGQEEDIRRSREAGFGAHLIKPVDAEALMQAVAAMI